VIAPEALFSILWLLMPHSYQDSFDKNRIARTSPRFTRPDPNCPADAKPKIAISSARRPNPRTGIDVPEETKVPQMMPTNSGIVILNKALTYLTFPIGYPNM
jgi:hypothetical protein